MRVTIFKVDTETYEVKYFRVLFSRKVEFHNSIRRYMYFILKSVYFIQRSQ